MKPINAVALVLFSLVGSLSAQQDAAAASGSLGGDRCLLFTPFGPLIVDSEITADGKKIGDRWNEIATALLKQADKDNDGKVTWEEGARNPCFAFGRMWGQSAPQGIKDYDDNGNGIVEVDEFGNLLVSYPRIYWYHEYHPGKLPQIFELLDTNQDKTLSEGELSATPSRLKSRDVDDSDLLEVRELTGNVTDRTRTGPVAIKVVGVGAYTRWESVYEELVKRYANKEGRLVAASFPIVPKLVATLDDNNNGQLDKDEVRGFASARHHVHLKIRFGKIGEKAAEIELASVSFGGAAKLATAPGKVLLAIPGTMIELAAQDSTRSYSGTAEATVKRLDADKNGYIERKELKGRNLRQYGSAVDAWDANGDGRVYSKEIQASFDAYQAVRNTAVFVNVVTQGRALFGILDQTGDGRLSLREMRTAGERMKPLDKNGDGKIAIAEVPIYVVMDFSRGSTSGLPPRKYGFRHSIGSQPATEKEAPDWFIRMDRNGDGDVTLREWLGTKEQFQKLDKNDDGFIEQAEAVAGSKPGTKSSR